MKDLIILDPLIFNCILVIHDTFIANNWDPKIIRSPVYDSFSVRDDENAIRKAKSIPSLPTIP